MRYLALAADYDGTLAMSGSLSAQVEGALEQLRSSGRRVVLVTGRTFEEFEAACSNMALFDCVVLENGAVRYSPSTRQLTELCPPASPQLARELTRRGVEPVIRGQAIVATRRPNEIAVLETIGDLGLELQIIFNGAAVMVLPSGVNKGSGLQAALREIGLSTHEIVGVGNAENDHPVAVDRVHGCAVANRPRAGNPRPERAASLPG